MATNKHAGKKSLAQNDFLGPLAVTNISATDVGLNRPYSSVGNGNTGEGGAIDLSWTLPAGSPPASTYVITSSPDAIIKNASSTSYRFEGLRSGVGYTFSIVGYNGANMGASATSSAVTATTVPETPQTPTVSSPGAGYDNISWNVPNSGGKTITNYYWTSTDGKAGNTLATSVDVSQEMGTSQQYSVRADNANGSSSTSGLSSSVTTTFSFAPYGNFGFTPYYNFGFSPFSFKPYSNFSFKPFGAFSFSPFGAFGFKPFGAFSFKPFAAFGFAPFGFVCVGEDAEILTINESGDISAILAKDITIGTKVVSPIWDEYDVDIDVENTRVEYDSISNASIKVGTITEIEKNISSRIVYINNDKKKAYTQSHPILARVVDKNIAWEKVMDLAIGDSVIEYNSITGEYLESKIESIEIEYEDHNVYLFGVDDKNTFVASGIVSHR